MHQKVRLNFKYTNIKNQNHELLQNVSESLWTNPYQPSYQVRGSINYVDKQGERGISQMSDTKAVFGREFPQKMWRNVFSDILIYKFSTLCVYVCVVCVPK